MNAPRFVYRTRQVWHTLRAKPAENDLEEVRHALTPQQMALFTRLQRSEQAHSIHIYRKLIERGERHPDLCTAALLHDAGKSLYPLHLWERVLIVLVKALAPEWAKRWGAFPADDKVMRSWRRPFVIAEQHPSWSARLAAEAGASPLAVSLIRRHHTRVESSNPRLEDNFLSILQSVDNES